MQRHGWSLLFHDCLIEQLQTLKAASVRAEASNPLGFEANANVKLYRILSQLILETVPSDPAREEYRQGNTLGTDYRHWRRVKIGRRFRLFFRYDSKSKVIVFARVNDEHNLRLAGSKSDPYAIFQKMLASPDISPYRPEINCKPMDTEVPANNPQSSLYRGPLRALADDLRHLRAPASRR